MLTGPTKWEFSVKKEILFINRKVKRQLKNFVEYTHNNENNTNSKNK
jgi:hypothetical protein